MSGAKAGERAGALGRYKPYPAYKHSGVEWLGEIPIGWEVKRLKRVFRVLNGATPASGEPAYWDGDIPWVTPEDLGDLRDSTILETRRNITEPGYRSCGTTLVPAGSLVLSTRAPIGHLAVAGVALCTNQGCRSLVFRSKQSKQFFFYELAAARPELESLGQGSTFRELAKGMLEDVEVAEPPEPEQRGIAAFLDRETARIDALVAKKEELIELLQEQRTGLITRAVTKGLDPNVPMKDCGVEWLGEIPEHWEVLALKRRARRIQTGTTPPTSETKYYEDGVIAWYGPGSFADDLPLQAPIKFIAECAVADGVARVFESGSAAIVTIGATIGKVAYMERAGSCNQQITGVTFDGEHVYAKYGAYQLKKLEPVLRGIAPNTTLPILDQEEVGYLPFAEPPEAEQRAIADFLDRETARIDALVAKVREAIERLKELRTALISAAVTGKIDVRGEVA